MRVSNEGTGNREEKAGNNPVSRSPFPVPRSPVKVLVADDTKMNQIVLKAMFGRLGVTDIFFADNGREALEIITDPDAPKFDIVLADMWMPEITGQELVAAIRANPAVAKTRVCLFTAEVEMKETYEQIGFDDILLKPANLETLRKLLP